MSLMIKFFYTYLIECCVSKDVTFFVLCIYSSLFALVVLREQHFGFVPVFFSYVADLNLFQESGKGLTFAVFAESLELRPD